MAKIKRNKLNDDTPYAAVMLAPNLILFILFMLFPIIYTFYLSFHKYDMLTPMKFVGLQNYIDMFNDETAMTCLWNTIKYTIMVVPITMVIALMLAIAMDSHIMFKRFYRACFFIPSITSWVAIAVVWCWLMNQDFGLLNYFLSFFGIEPIPWLTSAQWSLISVAIVSIWKGAGYNMLLFLGGLQGISTSYYEAAELDGASKWQQIRFITVPLLAPTTFFVFVTSIISSFQVFDAVSMMTDGGPGRSSSVLVHYLYQNAFKYFQLGYASAIAYLMFFIVMALTILNMKFSKGSTEGFY